MLQTSCAPLADMLRLAPEIGMARARVHEVTGAARVAFALWAAARATGPAGGAVLWLHPGWMVERPMGDGVRALLDPGRLVFVRARSMKALLWGTEEGLVSGAVPLVVAELPEVPALTPVRRLHLAAERGAEAGLAPVGLLLTPGAGGAPGVETRWRVDPAPGWARDGQPAWRLVRLRARMAPEASWTARMGAGGRLRLERIVGDP